MLNYSIYLRVHFLPNTE